jgi:hypothetical protein
MTKPGIRINRILGALIWMVFVGLGGCQKELDESTLSKICSVSKFSISSGTDLLEEFVISHDPVTMLPAVIIHSVPSAGESRTILPVYTRDTIYLGGGSYIVRDASGRITRLSENGATSAGVNGDFYYTYAAGGVLKERIFDDGASSAEKTVFTFSNDSLILFQQDLNGNPGAFVADITYQNSGSIKDFAQYQLVDFFPELSAYWPLIGIGRTPSFPIAKVNYSVSIPGLPFPPVDVPYAGYSLTSPDGFLQGYQNTFSIPGSPTAQFNYTLEYKCQQ